MGELAIAVGTAALAFALHLALWRIRIPRRQTRALLLVFFGTGGCALALLPRLAAGLPGLGLPSPPRLESYLLVGSFLAAVTLAYMITYSAVEADSPSLVMALAVRRAGPAGLPAAELLARVDDALLVEPRLGDLVRDGLARREGDRYALTRKGRRLARLFQLHRRILGVGKGG